MKNYFLQSIVIINWFRENKYNTKYSRQEKRNVKKNNPKSKTETETISFRFRDILFYVSLLFSWIFRIIFVLTDSIILMTCWIRPMCILNLSIKTKTNDQLCIKTNDQLCTKLKSTPLLHISLHAGLCVRGRHYEIHLHEAFSLIKPDACVHHKYFNADIERRCCGFIIILTHCYKSRLIIVT